MQIHSKHSCITRKGVTTLLEIVICIVIFAMLLMMLIETMSHMGMWTAKSAEGIVTERDTDFLIAALLEDAKSADDLVCREDGVAMFKDGGAIDYHIEDGENYDSKLYRNDECICDGIRRYEFSNTSTPVVRVYILFNDGQEVDIAIRR